MEVKVFHTKTRYEGTTGFSTDSIVTKTFEDALKAQIPKAESTGKIFFGSMPTEIQLTTYEPTGYITQTYIRSEDRWNKQ